MRYVLNRVIVAAIVAAAAAGALSVLSIPVNGAAYTCTQNGKEYAVGATICINKTPFKCVENRGWVKIGTSCSGE